MKESATVTLGDGHWLRVIEGEALARKGRRALLGRSAFRAMEHSHRALSDLVKNRIPIYGVNTQFGSQVTMLEEELLAGTERRYVEAVNERQSGLIASHNIGLGEESPEEVVRLAMALRAHCLGLGYSGVRPQVAEALVGFLNKGIHPVVRRYGSIGASGDLIPLSAVAAALAGMNQEVIWQGKRMKAGEALKRTGLKPLALEMRSGLALINGTSFMSAYAALALHDLEIVFPRMLSAIAMAQEALMVIDSAYDSLVHRLKNQRGEKEVSEFLLSFWRGSRLIRDLGEVQKENIRHLKQNDAVTPKGLQDYYSLRAVAHGFGPFKENLARAWEWIEGEMNSVNDNPVIDGRRKKMYHCANFMGYYVTEACDILKMDIAQASSWLHAILANLVHPGKNFGLPANLVTEPDWSNGFRPLQILVASLVVQNRKLAQSQQAYMFPTEGDNQDVNSLGTHAAFDLREATGNLERLVAILLLAAAQALELRGIRNAGPRSRAIHSEIRRVSPFISRNRSFASDIEAIVILIREERL